MQTHESQSNTLQAQDAPQIALVGNPNVGKSVIFGVLTGKYVNVSNYPGTTVEVTRGDGKLAGEHVVYVDTPGTNSFIPMSEDERVTRDIILKGGIRSVLQVGDGKNLKRVLLLSLQLSEMQIPFLLNLNMMDETRSLGIQVDVEQLSHILGVPVNSTTAIRRQGTERLEKLLETPAKGIFQLSYPEIIEKAIAKISPLLNDNVPISKRALATMLLVNDESLRSWVVQYLEPEKMDNLREIIWEVEKKLNAPVNFVITQTRYKAIDQIMAKVISKRKKVDESILKKLDGYMTHPFWGIPFLLLILAVVYEFVGVFGAGVLVDFMENTVFAGYINPWVSKFVDTILPFAFAHDLLVGEYGLITMAMSYGIAIVLPIVATFFIVFSILEDSGYLPRLALLVNRFFKLFGLNGKAVLPMVLGLGCDTMATMTARILETRKERVIVTLLLALGVPCSAQLGVILGMTALLPWQASVLWLSVVTLVMITVGYLSSKILPGIQSDFILELPPIRVPVMSNILVKTLARIEWYLKEVIPIFLIGTLILFILDKSQIIIWLEEVSAPVVQNFLGLPAKTTQAFLIGFLRRDYGAAGLFNLASHGLLNTNQIVVSVITITLFVPCIANFLMIIKELGMKTALAISGFIVPFAFLVGGLVNFLLNFFGVQL